ncbi:MAG: hypothetical protein ACRCZ1_07450 [Cetobacterium sp.]
MLKDIIGMEKEELLEFLHDYIHVCDTKQEYQECLELMAELKGGER